MWHPGCALGLTCLCARRYLQFEGALEELRQHRKALLGLSSREGLAEGCITRRQHFIYERATRKFKGDLSLWLGWLQLCKDSGSFKRLSKASSPPPHDWPLLLRSIACFCLSYLTPGPTRCLDDPAATRCAALCPISHAAQ